MNEITKDKQIDILLQTIDRYWSQAIQNENQRANFTNYMLVLIGAVQGYIVERQFDKFSIILSIVIIILSIFGAIVTTKYYERFREQASRVGRLMERICEIEPQINLEELETKASIKHEKKYPRLIKIRLNKLWLFLYFFLTALGIVDLLIILIGLCPKPS